MRHSIRIVNVISTLAMVVGATAWSGCVMKSKWEAEVAKNSKLTGRLRTAEELAADRQKRIVRLTQELNGVKAALEKTKKELADVKEAMGDKLAEKMKMLRRQQAEIQKQMDEINKSRWARAELARIKTEMARQKELNEKLRGSFAKMISAGRLKLINRHGRLVIQMRSKILFSSGKATLTKAGVEALTELALILKGINRHFQVAGHTDNIPTRKRRYKDNWALSGHRSTVVTRLLEKNGVPSRRLSAAGFSQHDPVANNDTDDGRALNRRIEITLLPAVPVSRYK